ncbi:MAG: sulfurtransferase, partial [Gaiellaceae bacterium]
PEQKKKDEAELARRAKELGVDLVPEINTKPFEDIAIKGKELIEQGKLDLKSAAIEVTATAERNDDGTLKPEDELRDRFRSVGIGETADVVSYCGSGVTACTVLLAAELAGLPGGRLYPGSWSEWSGLGLPVEQGR